MKGNPAALSRDRQIERQERTAQPLQGDQLAKPREHERVIRDNDAIALVGFLSIEKYTPELCEKGLFARPLSRR